MFCVRVTKVTLPGIRRAANRPAVSLTGTIGNSPLHDKPKAKATIWFQHGK